MSETSTPTLSDEQIVVSPLEKVKNESQSTTKHDLEAGNRSQAPVFPEGGWEAYSTLIGAWIVMFCTFGYTNSFGIFQSYYAVDKFPHETASAISWVGSVQTFLQFTVAGASGPLFDKGYFYHIGAVGITLFIVSFFMTSLAQEFWQAFLAQGVGIGLGIGMLFLPAVSVVSQYFSKHRGIATGIVATGSSMGGICLPIMLNQLILSVGFAKAVQYTGYLLLGLLLLAMALIRPFGGVRATKEEAPVDVKSFFKEPAYLLVIAGVFLVAWGLFFPIFYIQVFAQEVGASESLTFYTLAIMNAGSVIGRIVPNLLADMFGPLNLFSIMALFNAVMAFAFFGARQSTGGLITVTVLYGVASGSFISLIAPALFGFANSQGEVGKRGGFAFVFLSLAALTGSPIGGALAAQRGFGAAITFCGVVIAAGGGLIAMAAYLQGKKKGNWKI